MLEILLEYVVRLLALLDPGAVGRRQFEQRENQVRERLRFLEVGQIARGLFYLDSRNTCVRIRKK